MLRKYVKKDWSTVNPKFTYNRSAGNKHHYKEEIEQEYVLRPKINYQREYRRLYIEYMHLESYCTDIEKENKALRKRVKELE